MLTDPSFPLLQCTVPLLLAMEKAGADVIEVGVPFSDPLADGPTIQSANTVSLKHKTNYSGRQLRRSLLRLLALA